MIRHSAIRPPPRQSRYHRGADLYGSEDVFMTKDDAGYQLLEKWIAGETAQSTCAPTTTVGP